MSFKTLVDVTNNLIADYPESKAWADSPFNWIRNLPPNSKWTIERNIASALFHHYGLTVTTHRHLLRVNGNGVSVKTSLMWDSGAIKFQNIRDTHFDYALCLGIYPHKAFGWLVPKNDIWVDHSIRKNRPGITSQHKGADAWIHVNPDNVPAWLKPYGGTIEELIKAAQHNL